MRIAHRLLLVAACLLQAGTVVADTQRGHSDVLREYVQREDPDYAWSLREAHAGLLVRSYVLNLTSQRWLDAGQVDRPLWTHELRIVQPRRLCGRNAYRSRTAILIVSGGNNPESTGKPPSPLPREKALIAWNFCRPVVELRQVPNQRLTFSDDKVPRKEDALLAGSFDRFLRGEPGDWPAHLAMVKAVVRGMDAVQAFSRTRSELTDIDDFVLLGASKRGWTTWLTAAVDPRVRAIVPISIDMPNLPAQLPQHFGAYGDYARALADYKAINLGCRLHDERGQALLAIVDPWSYRDALQLPKFVLNSAGDEFFTPDSSQHYFGDLPGHKRLRYTVNTDHRQKGADRLLLFRQARNWIDDVLAGRSPPDLSWQQRDDGILEVRTTRRARALHLWQAENPLARDFRKETLGAVWQATPLRADADGTYRVRMEAPKQGWRALLVEATFGGPDPARRQVYTAPVFVLPETLPHAGKAPCRDQASSARDTTSFMTSLVPP